MREKGFSMVYWEEDRNAPFIVVVGKYVFMANKY